MIIDGLAGPQWDGIGNGPVFSPDGKHTAYWAKKGQKWLMVLDGTAGPEFDQFIANRPVFLLDGTLEYLAIRGSSLFRVRHIPQTVRR